MMTVITTGTNGRNGCCRWWQIYMQTPRSRNVCCGAIPMVVSTSVGIPVQGVPSSRVRQRWWWSIITSTVVVHCRRRRTGSTAMTGNNAVMSIPHCVLSRTQWSRCCCCWCSWMKTRPCHCCYAHKAVVASICCGKLTACLACTRKLYQGKKVGDKNTKCLNASLLWSMCCAFSKWACGWGD